jgi:succinyl-diaminopimelate desuccinylase
MSPRNERLVVSDLLATVARLVDIPSVSRDERAIADVVEAELRAIGGLSVERIENNVVARTDNVNRSRIVIGGHLDTVVASGNGKAVIDGETCSGCGSTDMKGGLAVMLELAAAQLASAVDVTYIFYACEEIARAESGLLAIAKHRPELLFCDAAVLLEPTGGILEAGCQGVLRATVTLGGTRAHSARPWVGTNAIHRLGALLSLVTSFPERMPVLEGCQYHESLQAVHVKGGVAQNVVPDEASITLSLRFAPDQSADDAEETLRGFLGSYLDATKGDHLAIDEVAPGAPPALENAAFSFLIEESGQGPRAKLGWTDVAFFSERGIPAANFGPGDSELAHGPFERIGRDELEAAYATFSGLLMRGI